MLYRMSGEESFETVVKRLAHDPDYRLALTERQMDHTERTIGELLQRKTSALTQ